MYGGRFSMEVLSATAWEVLPRHKLSLFLLLRSIQQPERQSEMKKAMCVRARNQQRNMEGIKRSTSTEICMIHLTPLTSQHWCTLEVLPSNAGILAPGSCTKFPATPQICTTARKKTCEAAMQPANSGFLKILACCQLIWWKSGAPKSQGFHVQPNSQSWIGACMSHLIFLAWIGLWTLDFCRTPVTTG